MRAELPVPAAQVPLPEGRAARRPQIAHEIPGRLRLRLPLLGLPGLDTDHLNRLLRATRGVSSVRINPAAISAVICHDGLPGTRERVLDRLAGLDHGQLRLRRPGEVSAPSVLPLAGRLALLAAMPILPARVAQAATLAAIAPRVLRGARSLLTEGVTVEVLDSLAVSLGVARGSFATALTTDMMMETGEYLEETTIRQSGALLQELLMPNPDTAWVERGGEVVELPFAQVCEGDIVVVHAGELVPVDGVVRAGHAQINQASITGESLPEAKAPGDPVIAGSLIESGTLRIEAQQVGPETTTARIAALIRDALDQPSETEKRAERHADRQVYMTLGLGAATLAATRDLRRLSSVFLVDYACPIKLSAPVAVRATMSRAAARGILIKGGPSIEKLSEVDTFVFDKTGTLTRGEVMVTDVVPLGRGGSDAGLLALAASVEEHSQHPLARAIAAEGRLRGMPHVAHGDVSFETGHGLRAEVDGQTVTIGSRHFLEDLAGVGFARHEDRIETLVNEGKMVLFVAIGGRPAGLIALRDELRADARCTVDRLRNAGVRRLVMLTGDRRNRAEGFGDVLGFDEVHAELRPEDKAGILRGLQAQGCKVAFVGDGINDAPALATANVGFSMAQGADIARAAADITLLEDRIGAVADARDAADRAMQIIRTNTDLALGINTGLFVAASAGYLPPVAASVMHNGTTFGLLLAALARAGLPRSAALPLSAPVAAS